MIIGGAGTSRTSQIILEKETPMTKTIQTIAGYKFHGEDENGDCLSCGYDTVQDCLCDAILGLLKDALSGFLTNQEHEAYLSRANFMLIQRDLDQDSRRNVAAQGELCGPEAF